MMLHGSNAFEHRRSDYRLDEDQQSLSDAIADVFITAGLPASVRERSALGHCPRSWQQIVDFGLISMSLPESSSGDDGTFVDSPLQQNNTVATALGTIDRIGRHGAHDGTSP